MRTPDYPLNTRIIILGTLTSPISGIVVSFDETFLALKDAYYVEQEFVSGTTEPLYLKGANIGATTITQSSIRMWIIDPSVPQPTPTKNGEVEADRRFMQIAFEDSKKSESEGGNPRPFVGAVLVKDGRIIAHAHRGELGKGEHAEYTLLERKCKGQDLTGATLYTTLEPCTVRDPSKTPCADRVIIRKIGTVVVGMVDPDPRITGKGIAKLQKEKIPVRVVPDLINEIQQLNYEFIASKQHTNTTSQSSKEVEHHNDVNEEPLYSRTDNDWETAHVTITFLLALLTIYFALNAIQSILNTGINNFLMFLISLGLTLALYFLPPLLLIDKPYRASIARRLVFLASEILAILSFGSALFLAGASLSLRLFYSPAVFPYTEPQIISYLLAWIPPTVSSSLFSAMFYRYIYNRLQNASQPIIWSAVSETAGKLALILSRLPKMRTKTRIFSVIIIAILLGFSLTTLNNSTSYLTADVATHTGLQAFESSFLTNATYEVFFNDMNNYEVSGIWNWSCPIQVFDQMNETVNIHTPASSSFSSNSIKIALPSLAARNINDPYYMNRGYPISSWNGTTISNPFHLLITAEDETTNSSWYFVRFDNVQRSAPVFFSFLYSNNVTQSVPITCTDVGYANQAANGTAIHHNFLIRNNSSKKVLVEVGYVFEMQGSIEPNSTSLFINGKQQNPQFYERGGYGQFNFYYAPLVTPFSVENYSISFVRP